MHLTINGEAKEFEQDLSVTELLAELDMADRRVAVEINGEILSRSQHASYRLNHGDTLEIVHAIGGGQDPYSRSI